MINEADLDKAIQDHVEAFRKPGVLTVRPGYKIKGRWITDRPAVVVTVRKNVLASELRDSSAGSQGRPLFRRMCEKQLRGKSSDTVIRRSFRAFMMLNRPEFAQPVFGLERDAQTGQLLQAARPSTKAAAQAGAKPLVAYTPAPNTPLHSRHGQDDDYVLRQPGCRVDRAQQVPAGNQDPSLPSAYTTLLRRTSLKAVQAGLNQKQKLSLVLDHPAPNPLRIKPTSRRSGTWQKLSKRQQFAWAAESHDPKVTSGIFPSAYHIKVAVKDHKTFWLSSGNWNNSNQPEIDPFAPNADMPQINKTAKKSYRDWHAIVLHAGLAKTFEAYLKHDLEVATPLQVGPAKLKAAAAAIPNEAKGKSPEAPLVNTTPSAQYFKPFQVTNESVKVQPVLTPDAGAGNYVQNFLKLIKSAKKTLYIQTQYLHPPGAGTFPGLNALIEAVKDRISKGVDVRMIFSEFEATGGWLGEGATSWVSMPRSS